MPNAARLVRRAHGELVVVELAEHHRAGVPEVGADRQFISRLEIVEDLRARGRADAVGAEKILVADRKAFERARLARGDRSSLAFGLGQRVLRRRQHVSVERRVRLLDCTEKSVGQLESR